MNRIKKGFTLIEVIIVLSIISILNTWVFLNISGFKSVINKMDVELCNNSIINIINRSKLYCRRNNIKGSIYYDKDENIVKFKTNKKVIYKLVFPKKFKITSINTKRGYIDINNKGITSDACTIQYKDRKGDIHNITMCVGTQCVQIKD